MLGRLTALTAAAAVLVPAAVADAAVYKVIEAIHTSSSSKAEQNDTGTSTVTWKLAKGRSAIQLQGSGAQLSGVGTFRVRGTYGIDVMTSLPGRCAWETRTGDDQYPWVAPEPFNLTVSPDPRSPGKVLVTHQSSRATLSNGYLGSECSTRSRVSPTSRSRTRSPWRRRR